jgi:hypothetical protein
MKQSVARLRRYVAIAYAALAIFLATRVSLAGWYRWPSTAHIVLALALCLLAIGLFKGKQAALRVTGAVCLVAAIFLPVGIFNPFAAGDNFALGKEPPSFPGALAWVVPLEIFLLASAYLLDLPAGKKGETHPSDLREETGPQTSRRVPTILFLALQIIPPTLMFWIVFGRWNTGVGLIIGLPMLYSAFRVPLLLYRKQFSLLPRPSLTLLFAAIIIGMGNYYAAASARYVEELARDIHAQCNRDRVCRLPHGDWEPYYDSKNIFVSHTRGLVSMPIVLTFNEYEPSMRKPCDESFPKRDCRDQQRETLPFTAFHLVRTLEDFNYGVYGGVGLPLSIRKE